MISVVASAMLFALYPVPTPTPGIQLTGLYSNMHWVEEAGDVYGLEIFIVASRQGFMATVQEAEGYPEQPVVVPVQVSGSRVEFDLPGSDGTRVTFRVKSRRPRSPARSAVRP